MEKTILNTPPDKDGNAKAWRMLMEEARAEQPELLGKDATVAAWIVNAPWSHPFWPNVAILCVHLRPLPDGEEAVIKLEGATHQIIVMALDPDHAPSLKGRLKNLYPLNFAAQFIAESDEAAAARVEAAVDDIVAGRLNPDSDGAYQWVARFGDNMMRKGMSPQELFATGGGDIKDLLSVIEKINSKEPPK